MNEEKVEMHPYWVASKGKLFHTPNAVYAMCRNRGSVIVLETIPVTWKKYF